jgi:hypothetical protein
MRTRITIILIAIILLLVGCSVERDMLVAIESWLRVPLPSDANDISFYENNGGRSWLMTLEFNASPDSVDEFTNHLCGGVLYQGYDPFDSIDTDVPTPDSVLFHLWDTVHYSHSLSTIDTIYGNRCSPRWGILLQIIVDKADSNSYAVMIDALANVPIEGYPYAIISAVTPLNNSEFPLDVIGMELANDEYVLAHNVICLETQTSISAYTILGLISSRLESFLGASLEIFVDNNLLPSAYISEISGVLLPLSAEGIPIQTYGLWNYCISPDLESDLHTMILYVTTVDGEEHEFSWGFRVE